MKKKKQQRLWYVAILTICLGGTAALVLNALRSQITYFYTPSDVLPEGKSVRLGGLVKEGSVIWSPEEHHVIFCVTDGSQDRKVRYSGVLPDLFREGQGVVVEGVFKRQDDLFLARKVLAKHDEAYMPPEVTKSLKAKGLWREGQGKTYP